MQDCMQILEYMPVRELTDSFTTDTKKLLNNVKKSLSKVERRLTYEDKENIHPLYEQEDSSSTMRLFKN
jgi:hypothetical protein